MSRPYYGRLTLYEDHSFEIYLENIFLDLLIVVRTAALMLSVLDARTHVQQALPLHGTCSIALERMKLFRSARR